MSSVSKIVVLVHGQSCVVNENCLYKAILKTCGLAVTPITKMSQKHVDYGVANNRDWL